MAPEVEIRLSRFLVRAFERKVSICDLDSFQLHRQKALNLILARDVKHDVSVGDPQVIVGVVVGVPLDVGYGGGREVDNRDGLPDPDGGEGGTPVPCEGSLNQSVQMATARFLYCRLLALGA